MESKQLNFDDYKLPVVRIKMMLDKEGIEYEQIDAVSNKETTTAFGITNAPTLLVPNGEAYDAYENASDIRGYIQKVKGGNAA